MDEYLYISFSAGSESCTTKRIYQYDRGRKLKINGISKTSTVQIHYSINGMTKSLVDAPEYENESWISKIPNTLTVQNKSIQAYIYVTNENSSQTIMHITIPIEERPKPDGFEYTDEEIKGLDYVMQQLNTAVQTVEGLNERAEQAANAATTNAQSANEAAAKANTAAESATKATEAANKAASDATEAAKDSIKTINNKTPDENGNINIDTGGTVKSVNGIEPDPETGNVEVPVGSGGIMVDEGQETHYILESTDIDSTLSEENKVADAKAVGDALKNGTAIAANSANADKLANKPPEYYLTPVNLLDNSDFSNPLNTNGYVSGTLGNADACIDGWSLRNGTSLSLESGFVRLSGSYDIWQNVPHTLKSGSTYTIAARLRAAGSSRIVWLYAEDAAGNRYATPTNENNGEWVTLIDTFTLTSNVSNMAIFLTNSGDSSVATDIAWVALYEGQYTADSLPPYVPTHPRMESLKIGLPVQPVNLLDNSNFLNPVNQRGATANAKSGEYLIDRWRCESANYTPNTVLISNGGVTLAPTADYYCGIQQQFERYSELAGKVCTAAVCTNDTWYIATFTVGSTSGSGILLGNGLLLYSLSDYHFLLRNKAGNSAVTIQRVALYEGSYTAETLPPYVPKPYAVELAACRYRYIELKLAQWEKLAFGESFGEGYFDCIIPVGDMAPGCATVTLPKQGLYIDGGIALNATANKTAVYGPMMFLQLYDPQFIVGTHNIGCAETTATIAISRDM